MESWVGVEPPGLAASISSVSSMMLEQETHTFGFRERASPCSDIRSPQQMQMQGFIVSYTPSAGSDSGFGYAAARVGCCFQQQERLGNLTGGILGQAYFGDLGIQPLSAGEDAAWDF